MFRRKNRGAGGGREGGCAWSHFRGILGSELPRISRALGSRLPESWSLQLPPASSYHLAPVKAHCISCSYSFRPRPTCQPRSGGGGRKWKLYSNFLLFPNFPSHSGSQLALRRPTMPAPPRNQRGSRGVAVAGEPPTWLTCDKVLAAACRPLPRAPALGFRLPAPTHSQRGGNPGGPGGAPCRTLRLLGRVRRCGLRSASSPSADRDEVRQRGRTHFSPSRSARLRSTPRNEDGGGNACSRSLLYNPSRRSPGRWSTKRKGEGGSWAFRGPQLPLGPGVQQAPEREGRDCRSGSGQPGGSKALGI